MISYFQRKSWTEMQNVGIKDPRSLLALRARLSWGVVETGWLEDGEEKA